MLQGTRRTAVCNAVLCHKTLTVAYLQLVHFRAAFVLAHLPEIIASYRIASTEEAGGRKHRQRERFAPVSFRLHNALLMRDSALLSELL